MASARSHETNFICIFCGSVFVENHPLLCITTIAGMIDAIYHPSSPFYHHPIYNQVLYSPQTGGSETSYCVPIKSMQSFTFRGGMQTLSWR